jgi:hypothetical protein
MTSRATAAIAYSRESSAGATRRRRRTPPHARALALLLLLAPGRVAEAAEPSLVEVLRRAGEYVTAYEGALRVVVAKEAYVQRLRSSPNGPVMETRRLVSDVALVRVRGASVPWWLLRDVYQVDGRAVRDRQARLEKLLLAGPAEGFGRARAIADEGTRYNLGRSVRNFNVPTLVLAFLHPALQPRFAWDWKGTASIEGRRFVQLGFQELGSPTVVRGPESHPNVVASGRVFIHDGPDGTVGRTELVLDHPGGGVRTLATLHTEYRPYQSLAMWVPVEMRDRVQTELVNVRGRSGSVEFVEGLATYSDFLQAGVTTQEEFRVPEAESR